MYILTYATVLKRAESMSADLGVNIYGRSPWRYGTTSMWCIRMGRGWKCGGKLYGMEWEVGDQEKKQKEYGGQVVLIGLEAELFLELLGEVWSIIKESLRL